MKNLAKLFSKSIAKKSINERVDSGGQEHQESVDQVYLARVM